MNVISLKKKSEKYLFMLFSFLTLVNAIFIYSYFHLQVDYFDTANKTCKHSECIIRTAKMVNDMNQSVDPCEDFYNFSCGGYMKNTYGADNQYNFVHHSTVLQMYIMLEEPDNTTEPEAFNLAKRYYRSCVNETTRNARGVEPIQKVFDEIGGWPMLVGDKWNETEYSWLEAIYKLRKVGFNSNFLIGVKLTLDAANHSRWTIRIFHTYMDDDIPSSVLKDEKLYEALYYNFLEYYKLFVLEPKLVKTEIYDVIKFMAALRETYAYVDYRGSAETIYHPMTVDELQTKYPSIPWLKFLNNILAPTAVIQNDEIVINEHPLFLENFEKLIANTSRRTIANYLAIRVILLSVYNLSKDFHKLTGTRTTVWEQCVQDTMRYFDVATLSMFVRRYVQPESKKKIESIVQIILQTAEEFLNGTTWMSDRVKNNALNKIKNIIYYIGYPEEVLDNNIISNIYKDVQIDENMYFESWLNMCRFQWNNIYKKLHKPVNEYLWHHLLKNPYSKIEFEKNVLWIPPSYLHSTYFSIRRPNYLNFGAIGSILSSQLANIYSPDGTQFNERGELISLYEDAITQADFDEITDCVWEQYSEYTYPPLNILKQSVYVRAVDYFDDNSGLKVIYTAYQKWVEKNGEELPLYGVPYTPNQIFWISFAQNWCSKTRIYTGYYLPTDCFRVIGPLTNSDEFNNDFQCPSPSPMNPIKKCRFW